MEPSIFTRIIRGELPCYKVYEDDQVIAILDIQPVAEGQVLVIPKEEIDHLWDVDDPLYEHLMAVTKQAALRIRDVLQPKRVLMIVEGFEVPHVHIKLIPSDQGVGATLAQSVEQPSDEQLQAVAKRLAF